MSFIILPRSLNVSSELRAELGRRLCPYTDVPGPCLETKDFRIWTTSLAALDAGGAGSGVLRSRLDSGTARFTVHATGAAIQISTDPLGTCPIWYTKIPAGWVVSPEAKAIAAVTPVVLRREAELLQSGPRPAGWSAFEPLERLPQGCDLRLASDDATIEGEPSSFRIEAVSGTAGTKAGSIDWAKNLGETLISSFRPADQAVGSFVSGGIDSSIACALARRHRDVATFSLGTAYGNEFEPARALADALGTAHEETLLQPSAVDQLLDRVVFENELYDGLTAEILVQLSALYAAAEGSCERVTTGYGSDLLFDGMLRHRAYMDAVGLETAAELIERTRWTGEFAPFVHWSRGLVAEHVFWRPEVIRQALATPRQLCFVDGVEKHVLRSAAVRARLLPEPLAFRDKQGLSEGTGANRLLSETLGIENPYGYVEKSRECIRRLAGML